MNVMWVTLGFHFLAFGPGMTGQPGSVQEGKFSAKLAMEKKTFLA